MSLFKLFMTMWVIHRSLLSNFPLIKCCATAFWLVFIPFLSQDSRLLGEIHVALLKLIIKDIEDVARTPSTGLVVNQNSAANPEGGHPQIVEGVTSALCTLELVYLVAILLFSFCCRIIFYFISILGLCMGLWHTQLAAALKFIDVAWNISAIGPICRIRATVEEKEYQMVILTWEWWGYCFSILCFWHLYPYALHKTVVLY